MSSRLAVLIALTAAMLLGSSAVSLASDGSNASIAQYGTPTPTPTPEGGVLPASGSGGGNGQPSGTAATGGQALQPARQVEAGASGGSLPFTGYAAIPVLLGGAVLLVAGLALRRPRDDDRS